MRRQREETLSDGDGRSIEWGIPRALGERFTVVSADAALDPYGVSRLW